MSVVPAALSQRRVATGAAIGLIVALPWVVGDTSYELVQLEDVLALIMVCVGLNVILGVAGQVFLGPSATLAVGAFVVAGLALHYAALSSLWAMVAVGTLAGIVLGVLVAGPALRFRGFYLGIATLYVAVAVPSLAQFLSVTGGSAGLSLLASPSFHPMTGAPLYEIGVVGLFGLTAFSARFIRARLGRRLAVLGSSEELAAAVGINGYRSKLSAFLIGSAMIGLASGYYVYTQQYVSSASTNASQSILILAACAIGGLGYVWGPILGGIVVFAPSVFLSSLDRYQDIVFGTLLIAVIVAYPGGLSAIKVRLPQRWRPVPARVVAPGSDGVADFPGREERWTASGRAPLRAAGLRRTFKGVAAIDGVEIVLEPGVIHAIVGPNGSGKTTLLNLLSGFLTTESGTVTLGDTPINGWAPSAIAARGIARTFQTPKLLPALSAIENIELGALAGVACPDLYSMLSLPTARLADQEVRRRAFAAAGELGLLDVADVAAGLLPHGTQRLVEVARAIAARPEFLLLDEPAAGLSSAEVTVLLDAVRAMARAGVGVALIEHNLPVVFEGAETITVLDTGRVLAQGTPAEIAAHPEVRRAYLGAETDSKVRLPRRSTPPSTVLRVRDLQAGYGRMTAVSGLDLEVQAGELVALVGRNGAGKTTALHAICGVRHGSNQGTVVLNDKDISRATPWRVASAGLALVPEGKRIFTQMSVRDNLYVGLAANPPGRRDEEQRRLHRVLQLFPLLGDALERIAGDLSGGGQQMVAIGQALMGAPTVLLLDEPASGLAPAVVQELMAALQVLTDDGLGVLFVDQSVERALCNSNRLYAMDSGRIALSGESADLSAPELVDIIVGPGAGAGDKTPREVR